jgi:hypothetical protein
MDATLLPIGSVNASTVKIQPVVLLQICDAYIRRNEKQERVIGTLLGNTSADGAVEVKSCYVVPHNESADQVGLGLVVGRARCGWRRLLPIVRARAQTERGRRRRFSRPSGQRRRGAGALALLLQQQHQQDCALPPTENRARVRRRV